MPFGYSGGGGTLRSSRGAASPLDTPFLWNNYNVSKGLAPVIPGAPGTTTAPGTVAGTAPLTYNPAVGGIPSVPDPLKAIEEAIATYTKQLPTLQNLATQQTAANQAEAVKQITDLYPQFKGNTAQLGADIADWAAGKISQPTVNRIVQSMAERGVAGGFGPDSPSTNAALMALMGKTSEALQAQALTGQNTLLSGLPRTTPTTVASLGLTPESIFSPLYNAQLQASLYRAAPDPSAAYNLAMGNLQGGLAAGGAAGRGPYAGTPTTGGTSSPDILKFLESLINRTAVGGGTTASTTGTSAYYTPSPYIPSGEVLPQRGDYSNYPGQESGAEFDVVQPGMNYPAIPEWEAFPEFYM